MSPLGIQRTVALLIFLSPFIFIPTIFKEVFFMVAGILLFVSTLDLKRRTRHFEDHHEEVRIEPSPAL